MNADMRRLKLTKYELVIDRHCEKNIVITTKDTKTAKKNEWNADQLSYQHITR
jgi:hypothetical protein